MTTSNAIAMPDNANSRITRIVALPEEAESMARIMARGLL
jgi:hypothetical protein